MLRIDEEVVAEGRVMRWHLPNGELRRFPLSGDELTLRACFAPFEPLHQFVGILLGMRPCGVAVDALSGVSAELARVALALGFEVTLRWPEAARVGHDGHSLRWLGGLLGAVPYCLPPQHEADEAALRAVLPGLPACVAEDAVPPAVAPPATDGFGYEAYAFGNRDHGLLLAMQERYAAHFAGCRQVLDLGCGTGVFLEVLARQGRARRAWSAMR